jgi:acetyl esterase/lipase
LKTYIVALLAALLLHGGAAGQAVTPPSAPSLPAGVQVERNLRYVEHGHERHVLDIYKPVDSAEVIPLIVFVHGGSWRQRSKDDNPVLPFALSFVARGYAIASVGYRLSQHAAYPAQIHDLKAAVRWLRANARRYGIDPDRLAAWGPSAGGHLAALLGTSGGVTDLEAIGDHREQSSHVRAVVDWFGPTDFLQADAHRLPGGIVHDDANSPESQLVGGPIQDRKEEVARANPITYVTTDDPPFLIVHGDQDLNVPHHQSELLYAALLKAGVEATFHTVKGGAHGGPAFEAPEVQGWVVQFIDRHLKASQH